MCAAPSACRSVWPHWQSAQPLGEQFAAPVNLTLNGLSCIVRAAAGPLGARALASSPQPLAPATAPGPGRSKLPAAESATTPGRQRGGGSPHVEGGQLEVMGVRAWREGQCRGCHLEPAHGGSTPRVVRMEGDLGARGAASDSGVRGLGASARVEGGARVGPVSGRQSVQGELSVTVGLDYRDPLGAQDSEFNQATPPKP